MLRLLEAKYGSDEVSYLAEQTGIPSPTLTYWKNRPDAPIRKAGRDHYRRVFGAAETPIETPQAASPDDVSHAIDEQTETILKRIADVVQAVNQVRDELQRHREWMEHHDNNGNV